MLASVLLTLVIILQIEDQRVARRLPLGTAPRLLAPGLENHCPALPTLGSAVPLARRSCTALAWWSLTLAGRGAALVAPPARCRRRAPARQLLRRPAVLDPNEITTTLTTAYSFEGFQGSYASFYATLGLYVMSFPGLWSTIKRATKVALVQKTYEFEGENAPGGGRPMREIAGDVMAYMQANNYEVADAGETITFRGKIAASKSQAFFLSFVTLVCLGSLALVLQIQFPAVGSYWFGICLLAPYAGVFYWGSAQENEDREFKVKLTANDEETETLMVLRGGKEDVERMEREMALQQQGMVRVKGVFEDMLA